MGRYWAVTAHHETDYVRAENATEAEKMWRNKTGLYFLPAQVRPTTEEEDKQLGVQKQK